MFFEEFRLIHANLPAFSFGRFLCFGTVLIVAGVTVSVMSLIRYPRLLAMMRRGSGSFGNPSTLAVARAIFLAVLG